MNQERSREINSHNPSVDQLEKDWSIRTQKDIVNFKNRDRDTIRNVDVELLLTEEKLGNIKFLNEQPEVSLKNFLANVIKTAAGRLHEIHLCRDLYLVEDDLALKKDIINGIPHNTFDDIYDLAVLLASHWSRNKHVQKIVCDCKNRKFYIYSGNLDYSKVEKVIKETEGQKEDLPLSGEADPKKKKKNELEAKTPEVEYEHRLKPAVLLKYFRVR